MNLSNISKHAKSTRNADSKRRKAVPEENPQPTVSAPVQDIQETFVPGEVHTEIPDEVLMDMSELDINQNGSDGSCYHCNIPRSYQH